MVYRSGMSREAEAYGYVSEAAAYGGISHTKNNIKTMSQSENSTAASNEVEKTASNEKNLT